MKHARFCEIAPQFPCFCNTQKNAGIHQWAAILYPSGWITGNYCFSLFCKDRSQREINQVDQIEADAVVSEEFEVMFFDISE